jgi:hypothetical protein
MHRATDFFYYQLTNLIYFAFAHVLNTLPILMSKK